eukprot:CAMPEP_0178400568 /NCGR_PEP_ID=MMETSP0689_2-20121128/15856_1 /TAXON_ID=160604 /ORGANISM="Amphidinium massartii, Strain CS-259" /LENGTH=314 /DNA_ID=CAMNT_0020021367 /DNA_START=81 /DNA_END=1022 /DNA_ORIENTATION=-
MVAMKSKKGCCQSIAVKADARPLAACVAAAFVVGAQVKQQATAFTAGFYQQGSALSPTGSQSSGIATVPVVQKNAAVAPGGVSIGGISGLAMILAAGVARARRSRCKAPTSKSAKITCQFFTGDVMMAAPAPAKPAFEPAPVAAVQEPVVTCDVESACFVGAAPITVKPKESKIAMHASVREVVPEIFDISGDAKPMMGSESSPRRASRPMSARFIGGQRRSGSQRRASTSRSAFRGEQEARRATGSKLLSSPAPVVVPMSFDSSKIRAAIQLGVRISGRINSEHGREMKTPVVCSGSFESPGVLAKYVQGLSW